MISFPNPSDSKSFADRIRDVDYIKQLVVDNNGDVNIIDKNGIPLLAYALEYEAFETTKYLLEQNADLTVRDDESKDCVTRLQGTSADFHSACLDLALERKYWPIIAAVLLENSPEDDIKKALSTLKPLGQNTLSQDNKYRSLLLYLAIKKQLPKLVKFLLENNVPLNVTVDDDGSPLCVAIKGLEYPSDATCNIKEANNYQASNPVMYEIIGLLLKHYADSREEIFHANRNITFSPLTYSVYKHDTTLLGLLLAHNPYLADLPPIEATTKFLCEADVTGNTPLSMAIGSKSRKMFRYLIMACPNLFVDDEAFSELFNRAGRCAKFVNEILGSIPLAQRKPLFQSYTRKQGEAGDVAVNLAMARNSLSCTSILLKNGANLPILTNEEGDKSLSNTAKRKLAMPKWKAYFEKYCEDLKAAEVTPSLSQLAGNVIYDHTHQNEFATEQLEGYLPPELFELYRSTPQRREFRDSHFKPAIRECLEESLLPKDDSDEIKEKKAKRMP